MLSIQCAGCKHYRRQLKCAAFPDGIPPKVMTGERSHLKPIKGDNGIQWEPADEEARKLMAGDD